MRSLSLFSLVIIIASAMGCKNKNNDPCAHDFDALPMLEHIGNSIILPRYQQLETDVNQLATAVQEFVAAPQQTELDTLRSAWQTAYLQWQRAGIFEFGPAETQNLRSSLGYFPVFTVRVEEGISTGSYDLQTPAYEYARGFPVLDYLLYGLDTSDTGILEKYTVDALASQRRQFISDVVQQIQQKVQAVYFGWKTDGENYITTFNTTSGVATGSPISLLINQLNAHYEQLKNHKIGIPVGAKTSYIVAPSKVEAYYNRQLSLRLALEALDASLDVFLGIAENSSTDGLGLDDYVAATKAEQNSQPLEIVIENQYNTAKTALEALQPNTLHDVLSSDLQAVKEAYAALQNQVIYLKTDMPAVLCVSITYIDSTDDSD